MHSRMDELKRLAERHYNVLMIADHGIGKTTMAQQIAKDFGLKFKYYSAATLDPFADFVGVPLPRVNGDGLEHLKFVRPRDIDDAEFILFDELNRAHLKVLNAVLEVVQFKTINGEPLPKLKMVWACINSHVGGKFVGVSALDVALQDRFHVQIELKPEPSVEYYTQQGIPQDIAAVLVDWWNQQPADVQFYLTPRRLEYMGNLIKDGFNPALAKPHGVEVSMSSLQAMLRSKNHVGSVSKDALDDPKKRKEILARMARDHTLQIEVAQVVEGIRMNGMLDYNDLLKAFRPEIRFEFFRRLQAKVNSWFPTLSVDAKSYQQKYGDRAAAAAEFVSMYKECGFSK